MPQLKNLPEAEMLDKYPDFDQAWGTAWGEMWLVAHVLRNADAMTPIVESAVNSIFDALDAILHHYDKMVDGSPFPEQEGE